MKRAFLLAAMVLGIVLAELAGTARAAKVQLTDDAFIDLRFLLQPWAVIAEEAAPDEGWGTDFYLRRVRVILAGQVHPRVKFFMETDNPNFGKDGDWSASLFTQDAYVDLDLDRAFKLSGGLMLLPFAHNALQGATSLNTLDYHSSLVKYPAGTQKVWRDAGIEARGLLLGDRLDYRIGVFDGLAGEKNPDDWPRFAGRLQWNLLDPEDAFFLSGIYFGKKRIVSFGAAFDVSPGIARDVVDASADPVATESAFYSAFAADVFVDLPVGSDQEVIFQANGFWWDQGEGQPGTGAGMFAEGGYRIGKWEPVLSVEWFDSDAGAGDLLNLRAGLNFWLKEHAANLEAEWGWLTPGDVEDGDSAIVLQAQVLL